MTHDTDTLALLAGPRWGGFSTTPQLIQRRENAVYRTALADGRPVALRLHRGGYQSNEAIAEELQVCESLADASFACPWPYRTTDGAFVVTLPDGETRASVVQWIDARPLTEISHDHLTTPERFAAIGALLADMHLTADAVAPLTQARPAWDAPGLIGPGCLWGDMCDGPDLDTSERNMIKQAQGIAAARLAAISASETGLIHGDALPDNILCRGNILYLIDFDDCGPGFRLYDLATALISMVDHPAYDVALGALVESYLAAEGPLPPAAFGDLPIFVMLRAHASAAWARSRCTPDDPRRASYHARAMSMTRTVVDNHTTAIPEQFP